MIRFCRMVPWVCTLVMWMVFAPSLCLKCEADDPTVAKGAGRQLPSGAILNLGARLADTRDAEDDVAGPSIDFPLAFSPDGAILATGDYPAQSWDRSLVLWDVKTGKELRRLHTEKEVLVGLAFSPDGQTLAWGGYGRIHLYDMKTNEVRLRLDTPEKTNISSMAFSTDSKRLVTTGGKHIHFWDAVTGEETPRMGPLDAWARSVAISPDGALVAAATGTSIYVVESVTGKELNRERDPRGEFVSVSFSPDGHRLLAAGSTRLVLWKVGVWDEMMVYKSASPSLFHVAFSPAGDLFLVGKYHSLELRKADSGAPVLDFKPYRDITDFSAMAFSPDAKTIATTDDCGAVLVWDIAQLRAHYQK